jgi:uroporphyrinogen decarboxylase
MHSDGAVRTLIPHFIQSGVDVLNPVEPGLPGNDLADLKAEFGSRLVFHGCLNAKGPMRGSLEDVRTEVDRIRRAAGTGGFIMAPTNHFQIDVPPQNIVEAYRYATEEKS